MSRINEIETEMQYIASEMQKLSSRHLVLHGKYCELFTERQRIIKEPKCIACKNVISKCECIVACHGRIN